MATTARRRMAAGTESWRNWTGDQRCVPVTVERPRSREELCDAIRDAAARGQSVHVAGSGHSFNEAAMTAEVMVRIEALDRVLEVSPDANLVKVEAGIALAELNE